MKDLEALKGDVPSVNQCLMSVSLVRTRMLLRRQAPPPASVRACPVCAWALCEVSSLSQHDDKTIEYCQKNNIVYEAYEAMRTCPFKNPKALAIAKSHNASVAQVCLRWIMQKGCIMAVGTGSNAKEVAAYAVRGATLVR